MVTFSIRFQGKKRFLIALIKKDTRQELIDDDATQKTQSLLQCQLLFTYGVREQQHLKVLD